MWSVVVGSPPCYDRPVSEDLEPTTVERHTQIDGAVMISFGAVPTGREALAVDSFVELSRSLGQLLTDGVITAFQPFFFADGQLGDVSGFFIVEGQRVKLDDLRRDEAFVRMILRASAATENLRVHTLIAGSDAGRLVNLYREVRTELGLI
jgi:hypothetical protein